MYMYNVNLTVSCMQKHDKLISCHTHVINQHNVEYHEWRVTNTALIG